MKWKIVVVGGPKDKAVSEIQRQALLVGKFLSWLASPLPHSGGATNEVLQHCGHIPRSDPI